MKITKIECIPLRLPKITDACDGTQDDLILRVHTDEGIVGVGEVDSCPSVIQAVVEAPRSHKICTGLADALVGENPLDIPRLWDKMYQATIHYGIYGPVLHAMSGIDIALWDIAGKACGQPVYRLLGGAYRNRLRAYASVLFGDTPEKTHHLAGKLARQGFTAIKFGWGPFGRNEDVDKNHARAAREGMGGKVDFLIDVGQCWDWKTAARREEALRTCNPYWLEEPLAPDDVAGYAKLSERSQTHIAAGEAESGLPAFERLIREGGIDVVQPDVTRCGGLSVAMRVADMAAFRKRQVANHSFKTGISIAASLHFLAAIPNAYALEYCMAESPLRWDTTVQKFPLVDGFVEVPQGPGLGVDLNPETIEKYREKA
jgi:L-alanine-DL-glutamate epimerase-like enolase superfamily enzyme